MHYTVMKKHEWTVTNQGVATREGNNVLITQAHLLAKDLPQMVTTWL